MAGNGHPPPPLYPPMVQPKGRKTFLEWLTTGKLVALLSVPAFTVIVVVSTLYGAK